MTISKEIEQGVTKEMQIVDEYEIRGHFVRIINEEGDIFYTIKPKIDLEQEPLLFAELSSLVHKNRERLGKRILKFDELLDTIKSICMWKILEIENNPIDPEIFVELFAYKLLKLNRIMCLFLDHSINEIYMDQKLSPIYVDHQFYGRCNTRIILEEEEINAILTRLKLEHPISISTKKPSLKVEFLTKFFHLRVSMDFPPLSPNGPTFNIRKLKSNPLTLLDLIKLNSLPTVIGAYLIEAIKERKNITIIGEPSSGKTTLANAIDLYTPKHWRKIAIEDAIESVNQTPMGYKHLSIQVDSFESNRSIYTKSSEILKLLHRSPDWIYLGEIQSKEHSQAMFEALNAGLKGIQTAHSDSVEKVLRRWENLHGIAYSDFLSLDIIIIMRRVITDHSFIRKIVDIFEVDKNASQSERDYQFLNRIYSLNDGEEIILEQIKDKSMFANKIERIIKRKIELEEGL